jgi:hypothetical protein
LPTTSRVYILLDAIEGKADQVAETLRVKAGVKMVDVLEGRPNAITMIKARDRGQLTKLTNWALASVERMTEGWQLLPTQDGYNMNPHTKPCQAEGADSEDSLKGYTSMRKA